MLLLLLLPLPEASLPLAPLSRTPGPGIFSHNELEVTLLGASIRPIDQDFQSFRGLL